MFFIIGVLKNVANFTGKQLCWSLFLTSLQACNFIKMRLQHKCFSAKFAKFLRTPFLNNTSGACFCNECCNFISTNLILRIKIDFEMFAARKGKKFQDFDTNQDF